ncbi:MAG: hypothetical protein H7Y36_12775 [Armatimonadetes bacterium]|nr:hypothetical protein [Akkermansiaceae bacterium]
MHPELITLLHDRLTIIADHSLRDSDPSAHLEALKTISEKISSYTQSHLREFDPKLRHYLTNSSYQKALDHLTEN